VTLIPALSYAGFASAGRAIRYETDFQSPFTPAQYDFLVGLMNYEFYGYLGILAAVVAARIGLGLFRSLSTQDQCHLYGRTARVGQARSFRTGDEPPQQYSPCLGMWRPGTLLHLPGARDRRSGGSAAPDSNERRVLQRVGAPANVRLGCQFRPTSDITITRCSRRPRRMP